MVPAAAAEFALVLPADLQIQLIEPADGMVLPVEVPTNAAPDAALPSTGDKINVAPLPIELAYVIVIAPLD